MYFPHSILYQNLGVRIKKKNMSTKLIIYYRLVISKHRILSERQLPGSSSTDALSYYYWLLWLAVMNRK